MTRHALALALLFCTTVASAQEAPFSSYTPLSANAEMMRRLYSPLRAQQIETQLTKSGQSLGAQSIDLSQESFALFVPKTKPAKGYGLIVFVAPWNEASVPRGWKDVMDAKGFIFVAAGNSGNTQDVAARREPLALLAWKNVADRYPLDKDRIYVAGMSGGSRVALRLALGYPDVFDGALLNAGSDPIGSSEIPLPPRDLFARFQQSSRLVYLTGSLDHERRDMDRKSQASMRGWCVGNVTTIIEPGLGHEPADPASLAQGLDALDAPVPPDPALASCRADLERTLAEQLDQVKALDASGRHDEALSRLKEIDARYGGLAAPESVELAR